MSWTDYRCVKCMGEFVQEGDMGFYREVPRGKCDGHCRKPHNLDPVAYGIDGEASRTERDMIGEKKSLLDT